MKRSTVSWTTAVAASALLAMPVGSWAQQPTPTTTPRPQTTTGAPAQTDRTGADAQKGSANEHLRQAQAALADIPAASLTGTAKTKVAELKRHLNALEQSAQKPASGGTAPRSATTAGSPNWSTDVAAVDRIVTELLGPASTTGAAAPAPAGTTGSTATAPKTTTGSKSPASITLDESARTKLQEVRTHITAFAAAMSGASAATPSSTPTPTAAPSSDDPSAPASASATASPRGTTGTTAAPAPAGTSGTTPTPAQPTASPATPADPAAAATPPQSPAAATTTATPSPTPSQQVDADTVKRHLTAARDTLSQLTQLPAAAQLTGDARTQVSQLISNFNELITTNSDWRSAYGKVDANLTALVGEQRADESPAPTASTAGAVGTSGTVAVDPAIRAKLVEFRSHLMEFQKAAGGSSTSAAASTPASASPAASAASTSAAATPSAATSPAQPTAAAPTSTSATAPPAPTATTGSTSQPTTTAGTSGTGTPMPASSEQATSSRPRSARDTSNSPQAAEGHRAAMTHIEAIEAILNGAAPAGTSGTAAKTATKPGTLDRAQIEQIRTHLADLRKELNKSSR